MKTETEMLKEIFESGGGEDDYIYTAKETPFSTCTRKVNGQVMYRQKNRTKARRYLDRHNIEGI